jgi:hypothetical protein
MKVSSERIIDKTALTIAFSCTIDSMDSKIAQLWVDLSESADNDSPPVDYHLDLLYTAALGSLDYIWELRWKVNNITEWGLGERLEGTRYVLNHVAEDFGQGAPKRKRKR